MIYRQGDVILKAVKEVDKNAVPVIDHCVGYVVAEGGATGHHHFLSSCLGGNFAVFFDAEKLIEKRFLRVESAPATLSHQEHKTLTIQRGTYEIIAEREHDYLAPNPKEAFSAD